MVLDTSKQNKNPYPHGVYNLNGMGSSRGGDEMHNKPISEIYSLSDGNNIAKSVAGKKSIERCCG